MKETAKAKPPSKPADRTDYRREWEANHPGFRLRFESKEQLDHIKKAAEATSAPSVNEYILTAAIKRAKVDLAALPATAPA